MEQKYITVKGARENNLKDIDVLIPRYKFVVMTGLSGSGKSSLAFDTVYAEGQRRYVESLSAYARQFLGNMDKPDVDQIEGLSPAISIDQKTTSKNPRSTVGTVTEVYDYLRLLYARIGIPYCPTHHEPIASQNVDQMINKIYEHEEGARVFIYSPIVQGQKGTHAKVIEKLIKEGYVRGRINSEEVDFSEPIKLEKNKKHNIEVLIDRLKLSSNNRSRIYDSLETALKLSEGLVYVTIGKVDLIFSEKFACPHCDFTIPELEPRLFSFNSPFGACPECKGIGTHTEISLDLAIDFNKTLFEGAFKPWGTEIDRLSMFGMQLDIAMKHFNIDTKRKLSEYTKKERNILFYGHSDLINFKLKSRSGAKHEKTSNFEGIINHLERRKLETSSNWVLRWLDNYSVESDCPVCKGKRLSTAALSVKVGDININDFTSMSTRDALAFIETLELNDLQAKIASMILKEIKERLSFLVDVGLDYLTLERRAGTLSGGEAQRIRLATQIGSRLSGVLYVLDEPSIGLHQRDNHKLIKTLKHMRDLGNTLIVVEHDEETMMEADWIIDIGPNAGIHGGEVVAEGTPKQLMKNKDSITGKYLSKEMKIDIPSKRRKLSNKKIVIKGAKENNLKNINVTIPLGVLTVVTGVSGSGKSSLINEILYKGVARQIYKRKDLPGKHKEIIGIDNIEKVIDIDQSPIGRTPRSNPATYTGVFDDIRDLYARTNEAKLRGYLKGRFSFNVKGGRCESCRGDGLLKIEMHFLPDVYVPCDVCGGKRYNSETLEVKYKGKNIADILDMTISNAVKFFEKIPAIHRKLVTIEQVGLGYIKLGQSATTLSGGEAQRVKLASELHKRITDKTLYILDEPTTGLHADDVKRLLSVLNTIVESGASVVIIEHNLDVVKVADHIIDLGPEGGDLGGNIIAKGTPEEIAKCDQSYTGQYLKKILKEG
ncbi:excinuclease ABC subunit UvrA [Mycoplasmatota bacterium]|nr:excinuclease ABC subunit UvrA [Mycoplasmatota bacterium]